MKHQRSKAVMAIASAALMTSCYYSPTLPVAAYSPGYSVSTLPQGYRTEVVRGTRYYIHENTYYRPRGNGYVVVEQPGRPRWVDRDGDGIADRYDRAYTPGRVVTTLPDGYTRVRRNGEYYYRYDDVWFDRRADGRYVVIDW